MQTRIASILSAFALGLTLWTSGPAPSAPDPTSVVTEGGQWGGPRGGGRLDRSVAAREFVSRRAG